MLIKESKLRKIVKEELKKILSEEYRTPPPSKIRGMGNIGTGIPTAGGLGKKPPRGRSEKPASSGLKKGRGVSRGRFMALVNKILKQGGLPTGMKGLRQLPASDSIRKEFRKYYKAKKTGDAQRQIKAYNQLRRELGSWATEKVAWSDDDRGEPRAKQGGWTHAKAPVPSTRSGGGMTAATGPVSIEPE